MKQLFFALLLYSGFVWGCDFQKSTEKPSVSEEEMVRIMADLCVADAATNGVSGYDKDSLMQMYFKQVLQMHNITLEQHEKNVRIYANDTEKMQELLNKAGALLDSSSSKWK